MPIESKITARIAVQLKVGRTPKGRTSHRTTHIRNVGTDLTEPQIMALVDQYRADFGNPVSKVRYQVLHEGVIWLDDENAEQLERKRVRAVKRAEREARAAAKAAAKAAVSAQTTLDFPEEEPVPEKVETSPVVQEEEVILETNPAFIPQETETRNPLFAAFQKISTVTKKITGFAQEEPEEMSGEAEDFTPAPILNEETSVPVINEETSVLFPEAEVLPMEAVQMDIAATPEEEDFPEIVVQRETTEVLHPAYYDGRIDEYNAILDSLTCDIPIGSSKVLTFEQLVEAGVAADFLLASGINPNQPMTFHVDPAPESARRKAANANQRKRKKPKKQPKKHHLKRKK